MTVLPGTGPATLVRWPEAKVEGERIYLDKEAVEHEAPPELYLRQARRVDRGDVEALVALVRDVGGVPYRPHDDDLGGDVGATLARHATQHGRRYEPAGWEDGRAFVHADYLAHRLAVLDRLGRHALAYRRGDYVGPTWDTDDEGLAWSWFVGTLNPALRRWHPEVVVDTDHEDTDMRERSATLLEAGALQLVTDLRDEVEYRTCANETCGQPFARQLGRGEYHHRMTGVIYCSKACADAQAAREYRRRKAQKGTGR